MIHEAFQISEVARRYFELKGEQLTKPEAYNRWRMVRNPDLKLLNKAVDQIYKEQKKKLKD